VIAGGTVPAMGLFSRRPAPDLPVREDLQRALDGLAVEDAERFRSKRRLADALAAEPADSTILAVLDAVITEPHTTDGGLLCATTDAVTFQGEHSGRMHFPLAAVLGATEIARGTVRVTFDPTAPGVRVLPQREQIDALDFSVRADPASVRFFVEQVRPGR
jgi:hypothetical protein